jgi:hypothetical protein
MKYFAYGSNMLEDRLKARIAGKSVRRMPGGKLIAPIRQAQHHLAVSLVSRILESEARASSD